MNEKEFIELTNCSNLLEAINKLKNYNKLIIKIMIIEDN